MRKVYALKTIFKEITSKVALATLLVSFVLPGTVFAVNDSSDSRETVKQMAADGSTSDGTGSDSTSADGETASTNASSVLSDKLVDVTGALGAPEKPTVDAPSIILIEANSGTILYSKDSDSAYYPASTTKIMTALLTIENCDMDEMVTFSYRATHELEAGSSGIARTEGEQMTVRDCLYALLVASANEVAQALAEHISGSFEDFAELMNQRAKELGCTNTHFNNPSGLNDDQHYTTAHDMALIMREAISHPEFVEIDSTTSYTVPATNKHSETLNISMKHDLLIGTNKYKYAVCGKTGYTSKAGFTLVTYATKDDLDLICVAMYCSSANERAVSSRTLFDFGFDNYKAYNVKATDTSIDDIAGDSTGFLSSNMLGLTVPDTSTVVLPEGVEFDSLTSEIVWSAESSDDGEIGRIVYSYSGDIVGAVPLMIDTESEDTYAFLAENTNADAEVNEDSSDSHPLRTIFLIAGIAIAVVVVAGIILNRFINGKRRKRKRKKVSRKLK